MANEPRDKIAGYLEVGIDHLTFEVVINHPKMDVDANGVGHLVFSENQARHLAKLLIKKADEAETDRLNAMAPAVHALRFGKPLCGFTQRVPAAWPNAHLWTSAEDIENITCADCLNLARSLGQRE